MSSLGEKCKLSKYWLYSVTSFADWSVIMSYCTCRSLKAGSHDPIFGSDYFPALFQLIEMLIRVSNFFEFE